MRRNNLLLAATKAEGAAALGLRLNTARPTALAQVGGPVSSTGLSPVPNHLYS